MTALGRIRLTTLSRYSPVSMPVCPVTPEAPEGQIFVGWDREIAAVKEDAVYTARFMSGDCPTTFTVATWNIGHFAMGNARDSRISASAYETESAKYRAYIEGLNADLLCVNEYSRQFTSSGDYLAQDALFAEPTPIYYAGPQRHFSCNAVFSKLPLQNIQVHDFECNQGVTLLYSSTTKTIGFQLYEYWTFTSQPMSCAMAFGILLIVVFLNFILNLLTKGEFSI